MFLSGAEPTTAVAERIGHRRTGSRRVDRRLARRRTVSLRRSRSSPRWWRSALVWLGIHTIANSKEGRTTQRPSTPSRRLPATPAALLVGIDRDGQAVSLTIFGLSPSGRGGHAIVLPAGAAVDIVDGRGAPVRLGSGFESGGIDGQQVLVESFLGITISAGGVGRRVAARPAARVRSRRSPFNSTRP